MLSTVPDQEERKVKSADQWQTKYFAQSKVIKMYNSHMGRVDLSDQQIATCSQLMKGNIW